MNSILLYLKFLAVAGGGGSSGDGGSSGGGGSYSSDSSSYDGGGSGDGDPIWYIVILGFFAGMSIFLYVNSRFSKKTSMITNAVVTILLLTIMLIISSLFELITSVWSFIIPISAILFALVASYVDAFENSKTIFRSGASVSKKVKARLEKAFATDKIWNQDAMVRRARETFFAYQYDWSNLNSQNMKNYLSPRYLLHAELMIDQLKELNRRNSVKNVSITTCHIGRVNDNEADDAKDTFTVTFEAAADDALLNDLSGGSALYSSRAEFTQYWTFIRSGDTWMLDAITPASARRSSAFTKIEKFSEMHQMFYSLDMGWLFIPQNGILFKDGKFGTSDINNHVIGKLNTHIVQLYTFQENQKRNSPNYIIAQMAIPKSYGGIIIQRKKSFLKNILTRLPESYKKHTFEWSDFNNRYDVYATDADRLAAFELLNPSFMGFLFDKDTDASIEVADNTIYVYKEVKDSSSKDYESFLQIIEKSLKELRL